MTKILLRKSKPIIMLDVDGVLLKWQSKLPLYIRNSNYIQQKCLDVAVAMQTDESVVNPFHSMENSIEELRKYNASVHMRDLNSYEDAHDFILNNSDKFDFIVVTAMSDKREHLENRMVNLRDQFGDVFLEIHGCDVDECKTEMFKDIRERHGDRVVAFVDDQAKNLDCARGVFADLELFHLVRGPRVNCETHTQIVTSMTQIKVVL